MVSLSFLDRMEFPPLPPGISKEEEDRFIDRINAQPRYRKRGLLSEKDKNIVWEMVNDVSLGDEDLLAKFMDFIYAWKPEL